MSSSLTDKCLNGEPAAYFVFFGFCTIAAIFSSGTVQSKLLELEIQGKVKKTRRARDGAVLWSLR